MCERDFNDPYLVGERKTDHAFSKAEIAWIGVHGPAAGLHSSGESDTVPGDAALHLRIPPFEDDTGAHRGRGRSRARTIGRTGRRRSGDPSARQNPEGTERLQTTVPRRTRGAFPADHGDGD